MRLKLPRWPPRSVAFQVALVLLTTPLAAVSPSISAPAPAHTTLVIFADHPLPHGEWPALFAAMHTTLVNGGTETGVLDPNPEMLRGDQFVAGTEVHSAVTIFLHGNCALHPQPLPKHYGVALGWVRESQGVIQPFVDVNCTEIGKVLGHRAGEMNRVKRIPSMADAMARVIVHEWIHIATQSAGHAENGVAKASFSAGDLLQDESAVLAEAATLDSARTDARFPLPMRNALSALDGVPRARSAFH